MTGPMLALTKFATGAALLVALLWAGKCGIERTVRNALETDARRDTLRAQITRTDSVFVSDTFTLRIARTRYDTLRRQLVLTDTVRVQETLEAADATIRACTAAVSSCGATIKARDSLIVELQKPPYRPRLSYSASILYDPITRLGVARGGPEFRLFSGVALAAELEARQTADAQGVRGAVRVGVRKVF